MINFLANVTATTAIVIFFATAILTIIAILAVKIIVKIVQKRKRKTYAQSILEQQPVRYYRLDGLHSETTQGTPPSHAAWYTNLANLRHAQADWLHDEADPSKGYRHYPYSVPDFDGDTEESEDSPNE